MRPLEVVLSIVTVLGVVAVSVRWSRRTREVPAGSDARRSAALPALVVVAVAVSLVLQVVLEGPRWQLVPVGVAALAVVAAGTWMAARTRGATGGTSRPRPTARRWLVVTAAGLGILLVTTGIGLAIVLPVPSLPPPDGPFGVGVTRWELVDEGRVEQYGAAPGGPRRLVATAWYPTDESGDPSPWVSDPDPFSREVGPQVGVPGFVLGHLRYVTTPAVTDAALANGPAAPAAAPAGPDAAAATASASEAPAAEEPGPGATAPDVDRGWPVVVYSHGWAGFASIQSDLVERLASEGIVVLALDHTYGAAVTTFPDGTVAAQDPAALPDAEDVGQAASDDAATRLEATFSDDIAFLLDDLAGGDGPDVLPADELQLDRVGLVGHSTGAGATAWLCLVDDRCAGLLGFDPWVEPVPADVLADGLDVPLVSVRSEDWQGNDNDLVLAAFHDASSGDMGMFVVPGATHRDFTLLPFLSPAADMLGLSGSVDATAMHADMEELAVAFFDGLLRGGTTTIPTMDTILADP